MRSVIKWLIIATLIIGVIRVLWPLLLAAGLVYLAWAARRNRAQRLAAIAARADYQHQLVMRGDPAGTYGAYPVPAIFGGSR